MLMEFFSTPSMTRHMREGWDGNEVNFNLLDGNLRSGIAKQTKYYLQPKEITKLFVLIAIKNNEIFSYDECANVAGTTDMSGHHNC